MISYGFIDKETFFKTTLERYTAFTLFDLMSSLDKKDKVMACEICGSTKETEFIIFQNSALCKFFPKVSKDMIPFFIFSLCKNHILKYNLTPVKENNGIIQFQKYIHTELNNKIKRKIFYEK